MAALAVFHHVKEYTSTPAVSTFSGIIDRSAVYTTTPGSYYIMVYESF